VGSGSGVLCRLIAPKLEPGGSIRGIDISSKIISLAREYAYKEKLDHLIQFEVGDALKLTYPDAFFDGAFAARLLLYITNSQEVIAELTRVVKSTGRIVLMDWDFETLVVDHSDRDLTRRIFHWRNDHKDGNNWSGRQLFRLMKIQGLKEVTTYPVITIATEENNSLTQSLWHAASGAFEQKIITAQEHESWISELKSRIKNHQFFASIVYFIVWGIVP
jgi:ubiquinone/menaquinone biosynthesis C-methylase UbiE